MARIPKAHYRYADALIKSAVKTVRKTKKLPRKRGMVSGARSAKKASYNAAVAYDVKERSRLPRYTRYWSTYTADKINGVIESIVWSAVKAAYKKATRKRAALDLPNFDKRDVMASLAGLFAIPAVANDKPRSAETNISRRGLLFGLGSAVVAFGVVGMPSEAAAQNNQYIGQVKRGVRGYVGRKAPLIQRSMGAGIRADIDAPRPKFA